MRALGLIVLAMVFGAANAADLAPAADQVRPVLLGSHLPDAAVTTIGGQATSLQKVVAAKPAILVFYRGGWCPYCNLQLSGLRLIEKDVEALGYQIIAITPDRPEEMRKTLGKDQLNYTLVSDSSTAAMKAFGVGYRVDEAVLEQYRSGGVDLEKSSGATHHGLPVPAVYIVDGDGLLQFSYVHPDFRVRVPADVVLAAARAIAEQRHKLHPQH